MPYIIRLTDASSGKIRDGRKVSDPFVSVSDVDYEFFQHLPAGASLDLSPGLEIHEVADRKAGRELAKTLAKPFAEIKAKRREHKEATAEKVKSIAAKGKSPKPKEPEPKAKPGKLSAADTVGRG
jgi:hypothetical protein